MNCIKKNISFDPYERERCSSRQPRVRDRRTTSCTVFGRARSLYEESSAGDQRCPRTHHMSRQMRYRTRSVVLEHFQKKMVHCVEQETTIRDIADTSAVIRKNHSGIRLILPFGNSLRTSRSEPKRYGGKHDEHTNMYSLRAKGFASKIRTFATVLQK